ncbi:hypothetical protein AVEN_94276-1 [Araneus ventricosus]|uniref:Uncharacterized protein n=1 Tax=Araneus ventricosus TaxID=182803 RepID=A0A4Y2K137_ARAVE|nr:hypothetical protein AVEN_225589-1 [Araneus ventricosus]GBM95965.1 hypothetical protein AVEN_246218-1 [Araneus ventricosus]GBM95992.1 hypothetical protein AVEN_10259-1 [Araneus ventricosus]GBM96054.1 hypothetical protein AVEN_94276-1 [Araneus ventricosus]
MTAAAIARSTTEDRVLIAYHQATARPIPKEVCTITGRGIHRPSNTIPPGEASARLLIRRPLIRVLAFFIHKTDILLLLTPTLTQPTRKGVRPFTGRLSQTKKDNADKMGMFSDRLA